MPIYRCNQCSFVSEDATTPVGAKVACGRCGTASTVYGTVFYVEKLVERYFTAMRELQTFKHSDTAETASPVVDYADAGNSALLATAAQHAPLLTWFKTRQIEAQFDYASVDTTGFFDDAALLIGQNYPLYAELMGRVGYAYRKSYGWVNLELANLSQKDAQAVNTLCRTLYSHTFFARYNYQKQEKIVRLTLQTAPAVRQFFEGIWLEWLAFITLRDHLNLRGRKFSCARAVKVVFANEDLHELDVVFLPDDQLPICIECKSGEFRRDIDKYLRLRKRLGVERSRFIICAADLSDEQAAGLTAMYELTFVNLPLLGKHLQTLA